MGRHSSMDLWGLLSCLCFQARITLYLTIVLVVILRYVFLLPIFSIRAYHFGIGWWIPLLGTLGVQGLHRFFEKPYSDKSKDDRR